MRLNHQDRSPPTLLPKGARAGFTLIELIVVIGIILTLAALTALLVPSLVDRQRASEGAGQLQGWLRLAKQKALRDRAPRGIRLNVSPGTQNVTDLQYIEQPDDFYVEGSKLALTTTDQQGIVAQFSPEIDFTGGNGFNDPTLWLVQPDDYLVLYGGGTPYRIKTIYPNQPNKLILYTGPNPAISTPGTKQYRIIRQPRVLAGEEPLQLPQDVAIDLNLSLAGGKPINTTTTIDILFTPSGTVIGPASAYDKIILWVRDITRPADQGDQTLVVVYNRTGLVAAHNIDNGILTTGTSNVAPIPKGQPAQPIPMNVTSTTGIQAGTPLVLDQGGASPEVVTVLSVSSATTVNLDPATVRFPHTAPFPVVVNPYSFTQDGRTSGEE